MEIIIFTAMKNRRILHGRVFVMQNRDSDLRQNYLTAHRQNSTCLACVTKQAQAHSGEIFNRLRALSRARYSVRRDAIALINFV